MLCTREPGGLGTLLVHVCHSGCSHSDCARRGYLLVRHPVVRFQFQIRTVLLTRFDPYGHVELSIPKLPFWDYYLGFSRR